MKRAKRSVVWESVSEPKDGATKCKHCNKEFTYTGGTTNLKEHLRRVHPKVLGEEAEEPPSKKTITDF